MRFVVLSILYFINLSVHAQQDTVMPQKASIPIQSNKPRVNDLKLDSLISKKNNENIILSQVAIDSLKKLINKDSSTILENDSAILVKRINNNIALLQSNPILKSNSVEYQLTNFRDYNSKDFLFYLLLFVAFILALVQLLFPKYLKNIFDIFFQPSFRQRQTREQLKQEYFAILLLNVLFVLSTSIFITLISNNKIQTNNQFWQFLSLAFITLSIIYITKYSFTKFVGWVFHQKEVAESYNFLVFLINKIIGVILTPLIFIISYSSTELKQFSITISFILIVILLLYRFNKTVNSLRRLLKISSFHFFIYFCSVEILPMLILFKAIGKYIGTGI